VEDMINGGLERLDPHSQYINARKLKQFDHQSEGKFGGVGIQVNTARGLLTVISPIVATPAYKPGVQAGDINLKVHGKSHETMRMDEAVDLIQADPGTEITLTVLHEGAKETVDLKLERAIIKVPSVLGDVRRADNPEEWDYLIDKPNNIAYLRL